MQITHQHVVRFHYTLKDDTGEVIESSRDRQPMTYLHGHNAIIPGLEKALEGKTQGESFSVTIPPEEAYGPRRENAVQRVPIKHLQGAKKWKPGMLAWVRTEQGPLQVQVLKVGKFMADVDINHPLAGKALTFDIEVLGVRAATPEEIDHGHVHGAGGHHH